MAIKEGRAAPGQDTCHSSVQGRQTMLGAAESSYVVLAVALAFGLFSCVLGGVSLIDALGRR